MSKWDIELAAATDPTVDGVLLRLDDDGASALVAFCGFPSVRYVRWSENRSEACDIKAKGAKARFAVNVYVPNDGLMKIFDMSKVVFKDVLGIQVRGDLYETFFKITRRGEKGSVKTKYELKALNSISDEHRALCGRPDADEQWIAGSLPIHDLEAAFRTLDANGRSSDAVTDDDDDEIVGPPAIGRQATTKS